MSTCKTLTTRSPEETIDVAAALVGRLKEGDIIALVGELGAGKTVFVKGLAKGLGLKDYLYVNSPSFVVVKEYKGDKMLFHLDVYRLEARSFCETFDYERYFYNEGITVVEWADKIRGLLPDEYLEISIEHAGRTERRFEFRARGKRFGEIVENISV
jgi:tRNA threonylcarbamoyladenosine biosynthesis protein TsaE